MCGIAGYLELRDQARANEPGSGILDLDVGVDLFTAVPMTSESWSMANSPWECVD